MKFASIKCEKKRYIEYNDKSNTFIQFRFVLFELYLHNNLPYFIFVFH